MAGIVEGYEELRSEVVSQTNHLSDLEDCQVERDRDLQWEHYEEEAPVGLDKVAERHVLVSHCVFVQLEIGEHQQERQDVQDDNLVELPLELLPLEVHEGLDCRALEDGGGQRLLSQIASELITFLPLDEVLELV